MTFQEGQSTYAVLCKQKSATSLSRGLAVVGIYPNEAGAIKKAAAMLEATGDSEEAYYIAHIFKKVKLDRPVPPLVVTELQPAKETEF